MTTDPLIFGSFSYCFSQHAALCKQTRESVLAQLVRALTLKVVSVSKQTVAVYYHHSTELNYKNTWSTFAESVLNTNNSSFFDSSFLNRDFPAVVIHTYVHTHAIRMGDGLLVMMMIIVANIYTFLLYYIRNKSRTIVFHQMLKMKKKEIKTSENIELETFSNINLVLVYNVHSL